ncbi:MAG: 50S ribosomal protein L9 [Defluviitaleaceae bacterium]|nr:50S ribosomal protein L9 [Defluviitaleaceae bacterium]
MQVILLQDIKNVGKKGQLLEAADGYARNYLIPRKMAVEATKGNVNELEAKNKALVAKAEKELENAKEFAASLNEKKINIKVKMGENGKLFGSVTNKEIAQALLDQIGVSIDKKKIVLNEPIKTVGEKDVEIKVMHDVSAKIIVNVIEA